METLQSVEQFHELKGQGKHVFLFTAGWCPDCRFIDPFMPEVEKKFSEFTFVSINRDDFIDLCVELNVYGIPSFIAYSNGEETGRFVSKDRKTQEEIEKFLQAQ
ncbi:thioredoxin family protein [Rummeliibacillus sp. G93]|uniref:Thiol reductase thioredoxin n=1 Tax=Rummeliibacillus stabekisii TaxID=241244 RepID=A0A143HD37_9BACL|nr:MULTISPECIES: thioredoxin family protein [Rummeliibacillus]AMW99644.1 thiol reductase thioredoxin [Rummeliibacillus stabekisii]MBB5168687.1 thiol-disulfide isomerase/thioredoxin [Rummeliibacillus stabekisii]MCM3317034.1 thioredoxin family protein [Rummeliibacillus stabekisii]UQW96533.1 thioredoxin family protein [Rummeliibacillus sp. G93]GEL05175.1 thiol reductase thioredoxin [Rummeliibacillus stabekisii]